MREITFIHAADLHLDSPFSGITNFPSELIDRLREATFAAFEKVVNAAIFHQVDFVVIAGDLYDGENRSIRAQVRFRKEMDRLHKHGIPVFIIHGNHDHLGGKWVKLDFPSNVHIFSAENEVKVLEKPDGTKIHIYGFSYPARHVYERMVDRYVKLDGADFHIAILHGNLDGHTEHGLYSPFTLQELLEKDMDYWALGHIHKRQELNDYPGILYPGNIQGRHRKETGEKGCYRIKISHNHIEKFFVETSDILWDSLEIDMPDNISFDGLLSVCQEQILAAGREGTAVLLELNINVKSVSGINQDVAVISRELLEVLQEEILEDDFTWPYALKINNLKHDARDLSNPFIKELLTIASSKSLEEKHAFNTLYKHPQARKYLDELNDEDYVEIKDNAERLVLSLLKGGIE